MLFPLDEVQAYLTAVFPNLERADGRLRWRHHGGLSELSVTPIALDTADGRRVDETVLLTHRTPALQELTPPAAGRLNRLATMSALIAGTEESPGFMVCKTGIFSTDREAAERIYAPMISMEAAAIGWHAACLAEGNLGPLDAEKFSPWSGTNDQPPYARADFEAVKQISDNLGFLGSVGEDWYTVEFPWDPGAVSQSFAYPDGREFLQGLGRYSAEDIDRMGGRTTLLWIRTAERHNLFGNGMLATLELPLRVDDPSLPSLVDELNRWELSGHDLPPLFGAWCIGTRAPTFTMFLPNQLCRPNVFLNVFYWARVRHMHAQKWLEMSPVGH